MSENKEFTERIKTILKKKRNSEQLTSEEEALCRDTVDKLLGDKKSFHKSFEVKTGDQIRKQHVELKKPASTRPSFEDGNPKNRGFEGGYNSKANVDERKTQAPNEAQPTTPIRKDPEYFSSEGKETPKEDNSGTIKATYDNEEYVDTDNKKYENPFYEEDRVGRYTERMKYSNSIRVHDVVLKTVGSGATIVGRVLKTYAKKDGQRALLVKWSTGMHSHVNEREVELIKSEKSPKVKSEEDKKASPPVKKAIPLNILQSLKDKIRPREKEVKEEVEEKNYGKSRKLGKLSNKLNKQSLDDLVTPDMEDRIVSMSVEGLREARPDMSEKAARGIVMDAWKQVLSGSREDE